MRGLRILILAVAAWAVFGCEGVPQPKEVDQGKADRAMEQVEKGTE
jgi:hypothetical protein